MKFQKKNREKETSSSKQHWSNVFIHLIHLSNIDSSICSAICRLLTANIEFGIFLFFCFKELREFFFLGEGLRKRNINETTKQLIFFD